MSEINLALAESEEPELTLVGSPTEAQEPVLKGELSPEVQARAEKLAEGVDLWKEVALLRFGEDAQTRLTKLTDGTVETALRRDAGEIGELLTELSTLIKEFDDDVTGDSGIWRWAKKPRQETPVRKSKFSAGERTEKLPAKKSKTLQEKYDRAWKAIERVKKELEGQRMGLMVDIKTLDDLYQLLLALDGDLSAYVAAGRIKLAEGGKLLEELRHNAEHRGQQEDILKYNDFWERTERFRERVQDLEVSRTIGMQLLAQVQLSLRLNRRLAQKVQSGISNAIPVWKQSVAAALTVQNSREELKMRNSALIAVIDDALEAQREVANRLGTLKLEVR